MAERELLLKSRSEAETAEVGERIGRSCRGGEVIRLIGPLGSGKSVLARGVARGLGITVPVRSPSFNLMREYHGRLLLRHWDLYRLESGFHELGLLDSSQDDVVVLIEWAEKWEVLETFADGTVFLDYGDNENERIVRIRGAVPGFGLVDHAPCD